MERTNLVVAVETDVMESYDQAYGTLEARLEEILAHGCQSGTVTSMIYYGDTTAFYETHKEEIMEELQTFMNEYGTTNPKDILDQYDEEDIFAFDTHNQNILAWFGYEITCQKLLHNLQEEN